MEDFCTEETTFELLDIVSQTEADIHKFKELKLNSDNASDFTLLLAKLFGTRQSIQLFTHEYFGEKLEFNVYQFFGKQYLGQS